MVVRDQSRRGVATGGINFETVDCPVRGCESGRIVLHVVLAGSRFGRASGGLRPDTASPVAAECSVKDNVVVLKVLVNVTGSPSYKRSGRVAPARRIWRATGNTAGDVAAAEKPNIDSTAGPFHCIDTSLVIVEAIAKGVAATGLDPTALVALTVRVDHGTASVGVHSHRVLRLIIDALNDIDFAIVWPARTSHPESRPNPTGTARHMFEVEHNQTMRVLLGACHADAVAATARCYIRGVRLDSDNTVVNVDKSVTLGCCLVHVVDIAMSRIIFCIKSHQIEKVAARVVISQAVLGDGEGNQSTAKQNCSREMHIW